MAAFLHLTALLVPCAALQPALEESSVQAILTASQPTIERASVCPAAARRKQQEYNKKVRGSHWCSHPALAATLH